VLCPWIDEHEILLDLHSFHTGGMPFAMLGPEDNAGESNPLRMPPPKRAWWRTRAASAWWKDGWGPMCAESNAAASKAMRFLPTCWTASMAWAPPNTHAARVYTA
jgi:hypothetical protein